MYALVSLCTKIVSVSFIFKEKKERDMSDFVFASKAREEQLTWGPTVAAAVR